MERDFQATILNRIRQRVPGVIISKGDYAQGYPDWSFYYEGKTAFLEFKDHINAPFRPNQEFYIRMINDTGGFARVIYPENEKEVMNEFYNFFGIQ